MGVILAGHGALVVDPAVSRLEICAIPRGTTLQFYSDTGQELKIPRADLESIWPQLTAPWPPLDDTMVTLNLMLQRDEAWVKLCTDGTVDAMNFNGHGLLVPGYNWADQVLLCTGTALELDDEGEYVSGTCPTDPAQIAKGWEHTCDGLLKHYADTELFWIACTGVTFIEDGTEEEAALKGAMAEINAMIELGSDPDQAKLAGTVSEVVRVGQAVGGWITDDDGNRYAFSLPAGGVDENDSVRFDGAKGRGAAFNVVKA